MPHNPKVALHDKPADVLKGEAPKTVFKDALDSIKVDLNCEESDAAGASLNFRQVLEY